jgi:TIR domain
MRVFISYSRKDKLQAQQMFDDLSRIDSVEPWLDTESLICGDEWKGEITKAIEGAAFFVLIHSANIVNDDGFVHREIRNALDRIAKLPPGRRFLLVARIDDEVPSHQELKALTWCDLFPDWDKGIAKLAKAISSAQTRYSSLETFLEFVEKANVGVGSLIESHSMGTSILSDIFEIYSNPRYPEVMSIFGEMAHNPIYGQPLSVGGVPELLSPQVVLNPPRIMVMDLYLVKALGDDLQPFLLQYFSGTTNTGWQTWLFPHGMGFQKNIVNIFDRVDADARDFEITTGLPDRSSTVAYDPAGRYSVSVKPDFGYRKELVIYVFLYCFVDIQEVGDSDIRMAEFEVPRGRYMRKYRWAHMDELLDDVDVWSKNADVLKSIHTLFGTTLVRVPNSLSAGLSK